MNEPTKSGSSVSTFVEKYGWPFLIIYSIISTTVFAVIYAAIAWGANVKPLLRYFGVWSVSAERTSVFILALAFTKLLVPIKLPVATFLTAWYTGRSRRSHPESVSLVGGEDDEERKGDALGLLESEEERL